MSKDILYVADAVSNEKGVDKEVIFEAIESALATATRKSQMGDIDVRVAIDRKTGDYQTFRRWQVIDDTLAPEVEAGSEADTDADADAEGEEVLVYEFPERQITLAACCQYSPSPNPSKLTLQKLKPPDLS